MTYRVGSTERARVGEQAARPDPARGRAGAPLACASPEAQIRGGRRRRGVSRRILLVEVSLAAILLVMTACGGEPARETAPPGSDSSRAITSGDVDAASSPDTAQAGDSPQQEGGLGRSPSEWSPEAVRSAHETSDIGVVDALRAAPHDEYDRFVITFRGGVMPEYAVRYLNEPPHACGSGRSVDVPGEAVLELRLEPARGHTDAGTATVDHAERTYDFGALRAAEVTCDFEGVFTVVLGTASRAPIRVVELSEPARVAVDIRRTAP